MIFFGGSLGGYLYDLTRSYTFGFPHRRRRNFGELSHHRLPDSAVAVAVGPGRPNLVSNPKRGVNEMFKLWGRKDGSNVIKVTWCLGEIGVEYERIDWGGEFGGNDDPEYRAKNPNGRLPTLEEEDGFTLWESGAVTRYICAKYSAGELYPDDLHARAGADKWMDWSSINFAAFNSVYLDQYFRVPEAERSAEKITAAATATVPLVDILDKHLADHDYLGGSKLTMADFAAGSLIHRWIHWTPNRPSHANVEAYYERLAGRPAYQEHVVEANRPRTEKIQNELVPNL